MKTFITAFAALALVPFAAATEYSVGYSEDFAEELSDNYGEREGEYLTELIIKDMDREFAKAGIEVARVDVEIIDAKPNRPTFEQLGNEPGLSFAHSLSIGGMHLKATAFDGDGTQLGSKEYDWYESNIRDVIGSSTWTDARRTSRRFARKFAETLSK